MQREPGPARLPLVAITQGDPAGVGPEICLGLARWWRSHVEARKQFTPLLLLEPAAASSVDDVMPGAALEWIEPGEGAALVGACREIADRGRVPSLDPVRAASREPIVFGRPSRADALGALAAIDTAVDLCLDKTVSAMVTAPINKAAIDQQAEPGFRGHTDYLASRAAGTSSAPQYGRDYLMAFLGPQLNVALLTAHMPLMTAIQSITVEAVVEALRCLDAAIRASTPLRTAGRRIALAGLNPHAGENGLLGHEDQEVLGPAVQRARDEGIDVKGPESADTLFDRARKGAFDWVLALYHDQGLIAVKTLAFGETVNWTAGLPFIRTSVDHGTAYDIAGRGEADPAGLLAAVDAAVRLSA